MNVLYQVFASTLLCLLLAGPAFATLDDWRTGPDASSSVDTILQGGSCSWLRIDSTATLNEFSTLLPATAVDVLSVSLNPDIASTATGLTITAFRCDASNSSTTNGCTPLYVDTDADGLPNEEPLTGEVGKVGFAVVAPPLVAIRVDSVPGSGVVGLVTVCGR